MRRCAVTCLQGPTPFMHSQKEGWTMFPHKFRTNRTKMVQATSAPRFPRDVKTAFKSACDAVDRAELLHKKCSAELLQAQDLDKSTPTECVVALVAQLKAGKVSTVPVDLALEIAAQEDTLRLLRIAVDQSKKAHELLMTHAVQVFQWSGLRKWVAEERVIVGPSGTVSEQVVFIAASAGQRHKLPYESVVMPFPFPADDTTMVPSLAPVRSEYPELPRWKLDQLGQDWETSWTLCHLREFRSFWVWCAIAMGEVTTTEHGHRVLASWQDRQKLMHAAAQKFQAPANITPTVPDVPDLPTVSVGAGIGTSHID